MLMHSRFSFFKKIFLGVLLSSVFILTLWGPLSALAQASPQQGLSPEATAALNKALSDKSCGFDFGCHFRKGFNWVIETTLSIIIDLAGYLITLAASLIQTLIQMNGEVLSSPLVQAGFKITLSVANLGFVLAIIAIAFATILRFEGYQTKKLLTNLIIAAVLINFSLTIAGAVIDFTNVFSFFFVERASPGKIGLHNFSANMAQSLNLGKLLQIDSGPDTLSKIEGAVGELGKGLLNVILSSFFAAIFYILILIVFFGIALMTLIRYVYLTVLLILMPLAWVMWVMPGLARYWSLWWSKFLQWVFFLPAVTFFLYLAMLSSSGVDAIVATKSQNDPTVAAANQGLIQEGGLAGFMQILIKAGLFVGALMAGNALGIAGASTAMNAATGVRKWAVGATGRAVGTTGKAGVGVAKYFGERPAKAIVRGASQTLGGFKKVPLLGRLVPQRAVNALAGLGARKEDVEKIQKDLYSNLTNDQMKSEAKRPLPLGSAHKAAFLAELSKRKLIGEVTKSENMPDPKKREKFLTALATAAKQTNPGTKPSDIQAIKDILSTSPSLAAQLTATKNKDGSWTDEDGKPVDDKGQPLTEEMIIAKFAPKINASEAFKLAKPELENVAVVTNLTQSAITNIYRNGTEEKIDALKNTLEKTLPSALKGFAKRIADLREDARQAKDIGDPGLPDLTRKLKDLIRDKNNALNNANKMQKAAYNRMEFLAQKIGAEPF